MLVTVCTSFLLISRTLYNLLAIAIDKFGLPDFNFDWINVSDQVREHLITIFNDSDFKIRNFKHFKADFVNLTETNKYISFVLVILVWELIPTLVVIILFKIKRVSNNNGNNNNKSDETLGTSGNNGNRGVNAYTRKSVFLDADPASDDLRYDEIGNLNWDTSRQALIENGGGSHVNNYYNSIDRQNFY